MSDGQKDKFTWHENDVVWEKEPLAPGDKPVIPVDELRGASDELDSDAALGDRRRPRGNP